MPAQIVSVIDLPLIDPARSADQHDLRAAPPPRPQPRRVAQVGSKVVEYFGDTVPTQPEVDAFIALEITAASKRDRVEEIAADVAAFSFGGKTLQGLKAMTRDEFKAWWAANVTNLAQANAVLRWIAMAALHRML